MDGRWIGSLLVLVDPGEQAIEVHWGEFPPEGAGGGILALLEVSESLLDLVEGGEIVGGDDLALDDGEVDLDLVELGGVHWGVHHHGVGEALGQPVDRGLTLGGRSRCRGSRRPVWRWRRALGS
jgi:hypothetical protein